LAISIPQPAEPVRIRSARALLFILGSSAFVILAMLFALSRSSLFALRHVEVDAKGHRSAAEVRELAGVADGTNVVWLDTAAVERRLESDAWIASASVTRSLPWTIRISVVERTPVAILRSQTDGVLLAADGTRLGPASAVDRLPAIVLPPAAPATVGLPGEQGAIRAIAAMSPTVRHRVRQVEVAVGGTLTVRLRDGSAVDLGPAVDVRQKMRVLRRLLAWERINATNLWAISLVAPAAPAAVPLG
jgi:cell division protein FtsQ